MGILIFVNTFAKLHACIATLICVLFLTIFDGISRHNHKHIKQYKYHYNYVQKYNDKKFEGKLLNPDFLIIQDVLDYRKLAQ